jgi:hypothetical protein
LHPLSATGVNNPTAKKEDMSETTIKTPDRGNQHSSYHGQVGPEKTHSAFKAAFEQIHHSKAKLREVMAQLGEVASLLKLAQKEQSGSAREIQIVRAKLREIHRLEL